MMRLRSVFGTIVIFVFEILKKLSKIKIFLVIVFLEKQL